MQCYVLLCIVGAVILVNRIKSRYQFKRKYIPLHLIERHVLA